MSAIEDPRRLCACGCGESLEGRSNRALYVNDRHRQRAYRRRLEDAAEAAHVPARLSLKTLEAGTSPPRDRNGDAETARKPARARKRSDVRVSYSRLVDALGEEQAIALLTPRQRARQGGPPMNAADLVPPFSVAVLLLVATLLIYESQALGPLRSGPSHPSARLYADDLVRSIQTTPACDPSATLARRDRRRWSGCPVVWVNRDRAQVRRDELAVVGLARGGQILPAGD